MARGISKRTLATLVIMVNGELTLQCLQSLEVIGHTLQHNCIKFVDNYDNVIVVLDLRI